MLQRQVSKSKIKTKDLVFIKEAKAKDMSLVSVSEVL